jgi:hypothetical protein
MECSAQGVEYDKLDARVARSPLATFGGGSKRARSLGLSALVVHWSQWLVVQG